MADNCKAFNIVSLAPIFTVTNMATSDTIVFGTPITLTATINNSGNVSGVATVTFTVYQDMTPVATLDVPTGPTPIDIGESRDISAELMQSWPVGSYNACATVI